MSSQAEEEEHTRDALILTLTRELERMQENMRAYQDHQARQDRVFEDICDVHMKNAYIGKCSRCKIYFELYRLGGEDENGTPAAEPCKICDMWICCECEVTVCDNESCENEFICADCVQYHCTKCDLDICVACADKPLSVNKIDLCDKCAARIV